MADAPRLRGFWTREDEPLVGTMKRDDWNRLSLQDDHPTSVDLSATPIDGLARVADVYGAVATRISTNTVRIAVFREDAKDGRQGHVNQDQYDVCTDILSHERFPFMVSAASTCRNGNMEDYAREIVAFTKRKTGDGFVHHLPDVPADIATIIRGRA